MLSKTIAYLIFSSVFINLGPKNVTNSHFAKSYLIKTFSYPVEIVKGTEEMFVLRSFTHVTYNYSPLGERFSFSINLKVPNFSYFIELNHTYSDGDFMLDKSVNYTPTQSNYIYYFTASSPRENFTTAYFDWLIRIECSANDKLSTLYCAQTVAFRICLGTFLIRAKSNTVDMPFKFRYSAETKTGDLYYNQLVFHNYYHEELDKLYFRIRPQNFYFDVCAIMMNTDVKFIIKNNNGAFDNCIAGKDTPEPYFMFHTDYLHLGEPKTVLVFKDKRDEGGLNLYLDPFTGLMSKIKSDKYFQNVNNIYLPRYGSKRFTKLDCALLLECATFFEMKLRYDFTIYFDDSNVSDKYYVKMRFDTTENDEKNNIKEELL